MEHTAHFSKYMISIFKHLVKKRWTEGNPITIAQPFEDILPCLKLILNKNKKGNENETRNR